MVDYIEINTDTGNGYLRKFFIGDNEYTSISKRQVGPLYDREDAFIRAREEGYQTVVKTSVGTYYLKCHQGDISREEVIFRLDLMWRNNFKNCRTTYFLR